MIIFGLRGYDRSWAVGTVACTALFATGISLWSVMVSDRLPAELATHWNEQNIAGGFEPLFGINCCFRSRPSCCAPWSAGWPSPAAAPR